MKQATRIMMMSDRAKRAGNGEHEQMGGKRWEGGANNMEQPKYNEDWVGNKVREQRHNEHRARHDGTDPLEGEGRDPYSGRGMRREHGRQRYEDDEDEEEYGKPRHKHSEGSAWPEHEKKHEKKEYKEVDEECAMKWVRKMQNGDGSKAPHFRPDLAEQMRKDMCPECKKWEWYVAINMMYADYAEVAKKLGVDRDEYYAHMAKAFLMDEDAGVHKLAKYMETIPKED